jgi:hypothetical protein
MDADTLHAASDRIMDALTEELAAIRQEPAPRERFVFDQMPPNQPPPNQPPPNQPPPNQPPPNQEDQS